MNPYIVIAAYNEAAHISSVVKDVLAQGYKHVLVVDDGSRDKTSILAEKAGAKVLRHAINLGKGAAVRTGCDFAVDSGATHLVLIDGDGQHEPEEIPHFLSALDKKDIVFGARKRSKDMPSLYRVGNWGLNVLSKLFFGITLRDTQCGFRAMSVDAYNKVRWDSSDYAMESEMVVRAGLARLSYAERSIKTIYHDRYKGTGVVDGVKIFGHMLKWRVTLW